MKRLLCGSVVLAASLALASCNGDPTSEGRGDPTRILAEPSSLFLDQGAVRAVTVTLLDEQGEPLPGSFEVSSPGTGITVARNDEFLGTTVGGPLESQAQFIVTAGDAPVSSSFTLAAGGLSIEIPVRVTPTSVVATFSNTTPAMNEPVTVTAEGYSFLPEAAVSFAGDTAITLSNDGTSLTFLPSPGSTGPALIEGIAISFLPTTPLSLASTEEITVGPLAPIGGTADPATAPALPIPAVGEITGFYDGPDFAATPDHFYSMTITEAGVYTVTMDWDIGSDLDMFLCPAPGAITASCDFQAATGNHPEVATFTLEPGTYFVVADDYGADAIGTELEFVVEHAAPEAVLRRLAPPAPKARK